METQGGLFGETKKPHRWWHGGVVPGFDGKTYTPELDYARLGKQLRAVFEFMLDGEWHTLAEISAGVGSPEASVSARLRDFRKVRFGGFTLERERCGPGKNGLHRYRLLKSAPGA